MNAIGRPGSYCPGTYVWYVCGVPGKNFPGASVWRVGEEPDAPWVFSSAPRHAHLAGFDLHANLAVSAGDRARLEQLCRYLLRPRNP